MNNNYGTFCTDAGGVSQHIVGAPLPLGARTMSTVGLLDILAPLNAEERRQFALYMAFAAETANRECSDTHGTLLDINTLATITGVWL
jgi:hypothetical protein